MEDEYEIIMRTGYDERSK